MMPMKETMEKPRGIPRSCGQTAEDGRWARDAKSGAFLIQERKPMRYVRIGNKDVMTHTIRVAILLMQEPKAATMAHPLADPCRVPCW